MNWKRRLLIFSLLGLAGAGLPVYPAVKGAVRPEPLPQPVKVGDHYEFEGGVLYRRPGCVPQLVVNGTHYQMGREYGVLLRPEIKYTNTNRCQNG